MKKIGKYENFKKIIINKEYSDEEIAKMVDPNCTPGAIRAARFRFLKPQQHSFNAINWVNKNPLKVAGKRDRYREKFKKNKINKNTPWLIKDEILILIKLIPDKDLSKRLGRPITAIWSQRSKRKKQVLTPGKLIIVNHADLPKTHLHIVQVNHNSPLKVLSCDVPTTIWKDNVFEINWQATFFYRENIKTVLHQLQKHCNNSYRLFTELSFINCAFR